jgi:hypothetical protein
MLLDADCEGIPTVLNTLDHHRISILSKGAGATLDSEALKYIAESAEFLHVLRERLALAQPVKE